MESSKTVRRAGIGVCISVLPFAAGRASAAQSPEVSAPEPAERAASTETQDPPAATPGIRDRIPAFRDLFTALPGDFRAMASRRNAGFAVIGALGGVGVQAMDQPVARSAWGAKSVDPFFAPGQHVGGFVLQTSAAFATYFTGRAMGNSRVAVLGARLVRAQIVAQVTTQAIKFSVQRTRPDGTALSFPSGHTSASFATATVLHSGFGWRVGLPAYAVAAWVGASRMERQRHYLSDVVVGATIGILAGRSVTIGKGAARFEMSPMAAPGGVGISFVKVGK